MKKRITIASLFIFAISVFLGIFFVADQYNSNKQEGNILVKNDTALEIPPQKTAELEENTKNTATNTKPQEQVSEKKENQAHTNLFPPKKEQNQQSENLSLAETQLILAAHNKARNAVGTNALIWSPVLALQAGEWAESLSKTCTPSHASASVRRGKGENIWAGYGYDIWSVSEMVHDWIVEKKDYTHETNTCTLGATCGHYTQIVWNTTTEIGCGITSCTESGQAGKIFVCRYSEAGNIPNQKPY